MWLLCSPTCQLMCSCRCGAHKYWERSFYNWNTVDIHAKYTNGGLTKAWALMVNVQWFLYERCIYYLQYLMCFNQINRNALRLGHMSLMLVTWQNLECLISELFSRQILCQLKVKKSGINHQNIVIIYWRISSVINLSYFANYDNSTLNISINIYSNSQ